MFNIGSSPVDDMGALMANLSHPIARGRAINSIAQKYGGVDKFAGYYSRLTGKDPQQVADQVRNSLLAAGDSTDAANIPGAAAPQAPAATAPMDPLAAQGPNLPTNPGLNANNVTPLQSEQRGYAAGGQVGDARTMRYENSMAETHRGNAMLDQRKAEDEESELNDMREHQRRVEEAYQARRAQPSGGIRVIPDRQYARGGIVQHFDDGGFAQGNLPPLQQQRLPMWYDGGLSGQAQGPAAAAPGTGGIVPPDQSQNPYAAGLERESQNLENYKTPGPTERSQFEKWLPVLTAGLGMGASKNTNALGALSEGALLGVKQYDVQRREDVAEKQANDKLAQQFQLEKMKERIQSLRALSSDWTKSDIERQRADLQAKQLTEIARRQELALKTHSEDQINNQNAIAARQITAQTAAAQKAADTQLSITDRNNTSTASREAIAAQRVAAQAKIATDRNDLKTLLQTQAENAKAGIVDKTLDARTANLQSRLDSNEYVAELRGRNASDRQKEKIALGALQNGNPELYRALAPDLGLDVSEDTITALSDRKSVNTAVQQSAKLYGPDDAGKRVAFVTAFSKNGGDIQRAMEEAGVPEKKGTIHTFMDGDNRVTALLDKGGNELKRISTAPRSANYQNWVIGGGTPQAMVVRSNDGKTFIDDKGNSQPLPAQAQKMHTTVQQGADFTTPQKKEGVDYRTHETAAAETVNLTQRLREQLADSGTPTEAIGKITRFLDITANQAHQAAAQLNNFTPGEIAADKELLDPKKYNFSALKGPAAKSAALQLNLTQLAYTVARQNVGGRLSNQEIQQWIDRLGSGSKTQLSAALDEVEAHAVSGITTRREQAANYGVTLPSELSAIGDARSRIATREAAAKAAPAANAAPSARLPWIDPRKTRSGKVYGPDPIDNADWESLGDGRMRRIPAPEAQ